MKSIQACMLVMAFAASGSYFSMAQAPKEAAKKEPAGESKEQSATREIHGKIQSVKGTLVTIQTRTGILVEVDAKSAIERYRSVPLVVGRAVEVKGTVDKKGVLHAETLQRAKDAPSVWPADR